MEWFPAIPAAAALGIALLAIFVVRIRERALRLNSPFADDFIRAPGHDLRIRAEAAYRSLWRGLLLAMTWPLLVYAVWASMHLEMGMRRSALADLGFTVAVVLGFGWALVFLVRAERKFRRLRLALDAEISTGQTLTGLLGQGCRLVHDVFVPGGRIAHVLVMPSGVHAIRTIAYLKRGRGRGREDVTVHVEVDKLRLPHGTDAVALPLAHKQAQLLAGQLSGALGHAVLVRGALALPGWRVEQSAGSVSRVFNPRDATALLAGPAVLSAAKIDEIAALLEAMVPAAARAPDARSPVLERKEPRIE
jgi:hypothetical protein